MAAKQKYIVTANAFRQTVKDGDDTHYVRHTRGDEVELTKQEAERLVATGGLALADEDQVLSTQTSTQTVGTPDPPAGTTGTEPAATSGQTADEGLRGDADAEGDSSAPEGDDVFEAMSYPELQDAARSRGLDAGGKKGDLLDRLREYTAGDNE